MEFIEGMTLDAWIRAAPRDWQSVVRLFGAIGNGLSAAHAQGLVHRDFKPGNVLVDPRGRPVIIDFGLARLVDEALADEGDESPAATEDSPTVPAPESLSALSDLTRASRLRGTPAYMAPEVLAGGAHTAASDQFSCCISLYEALFQAPPFPRDSLAGMHHAMATGRVAQTPANAVAQAVVETLLRGLSLRPEQRFPGVDALMTALAAPLPHDEGAGPSHLRFTRLVVPLFTAAVLVAFNVVDGLLGVPVDGWDVFRGSGLAALGLGIPLLLLRRLDLHSPLRSPIPDSLLLLLAVKQVAVGLGAHLGMTAHQLLAIDAVMIFGFVAVIDLLLRLGTRLPIIAGVALFSLILAAQKHAFLTHHAAIAVLTVGFLVTIDGGPGKA